MCFGVILLTFGCGAADPDPHTPPRTSPPRTSQPGNERAPRDTLQATEGASSTPTVSGLHDLTVSRLMACALDNDGLFWCYDEEDPRPPALRRVPGVPPMQSMEGLFGSGERCGISREGRTICVVGSEVHDLGAEAVEIRDSLARTSDGAWRVLRLGNSQHPVFFEDLPPELAEFDLFGDQRQAIRWLAQNDGRLALFRAWRDRRDDEESYELDPIPLGEVSARVVAAISLRTRSIPRCAVLENGAVPCWTATGEPLEPHAADGRGRRDIEAASVPDAQGRRGEELLCVPTGDSIECEGIRDRGITVSVPIAAREIDANLQMFCALDADGMSCVVTRRNPNLNRPTTPTQFTRILPAHDAP